MSTFTTPKGSILPILNLRGKDYLQVQHRIVWFTEERPGWSIHTVLVDRGPTHCLAMAEILDDKNQVRATAHKYEDKQGFADFIEKAETGAIGRALALCGFGTQFCADDLDEGNRLADAPASRVTPTPFTAPVKPAVAPAIAPQTKLQEPVRPFEHPKAEDPADARRAKVLAAAHNSNWIPQSVSQYITARYNKSLVREMTDVEIAELLEVMKTKPASEAIADAISEDTSFTFGANAKEQIK